MKKMSSVIEQILADPTTDSVIIYNLAESNPDAKQPEDFHLLPLSIIDRLKTLDNTSLTIVKQQEIAWEKTLAHIEEK